MMSSKASLYIAVGTVIGVIAGALVGYFVPGFATATAFIGQLFLGALRLVVLPLIVVAIVLGIGSLMTRQRVGRTLGTTLVYFVATTAVAILIGLIVVNVVGPGHGVDSAGLNAPQAVQQARAVSTGDIISTLFPSNPLVVMTAGRYFALIFFSFLLGAVLAVMGQRRRPVLDFFRSLSDAVMTLVQWVMYAAPIGLFFLVGAAVARNGAAPDELFLRMGSFMLCLAIGLLIHAVVVLPLVLKLWGNRSVGEYFVKMLPTFGTVLGTNSPTASLPATFHSVVGEVKVDNRAASAVLPLGATMNLNATAMWTVIGAFFVAQSIGLSLSFGQVLVIALGALVASFVTAGVPGAGLLIIAVVFDLAGMPEAAFGALALIAATDWLSERVRNAVDVWSDAVGASVVAARLTKSSRKSGDRRGRKPEDKSKEDRRSRREQSNGRDKSAERRPDRGRDRGGRKPERQDKERSRRGDRRSGKERRQRTSRDTSKPDRRREQRRRDDRRGQQEDRRKTPENQSPFDLKQDNIVDLEATPEQMAEEVVGGPKGPEKEGSTEPRRKEHERGQSRPSRAERSEGRQSDQRDRPKRQSGGHRGGRPPVSRQDERSEKEPSSPGPDPTERERARVEDQMRELDKKQESDAGEDRPQIDFSAEDWDKEEPERPAEEARKPEDESAETPEDKSEPAVKEMPSGPIQYGRTKHRRGWGLKGGADEESEEPEEKSEDESATESETAEDDELKTVPESFSTDEQSFGRTKKKRTR